MNFSPFGGFPGSGTIPIHQLVATSSQENANRYHSSINTNVNMAHFNQPHVPILGKYNGHLATTTTSATSATSSSHPQYGSLQYSTQHSDINSIAEKQRSGSTNYTQSITTPTTQTQATEISQDISAILQQQQADTKRVLQNVNPSWQSLAPGSTVADYLSHLPASTLPLSLHHFLKYSAESIKKEAQNPLTTIDMSQAQVASQGINLNNLTSSILPTSSIANIISQQTQEQILSQQQQDGSQQHQQQQLATAATGTAPTKKKKKKRPPKERKPKPKPGEIRLTKALDGSILYCCPECQMAYPERGLLEEHLVGHNLERRFICEICNAALKRKDHLTRHKQSHNPERPFVCTICLKAFKRKEQLTLHIVIHSGEKRHICIECGKGFYRKDHLRKHTRSHIARRVKAELSLQQPPQPQPPAGSPSTNSNNIQPIQTNQQQSASQQQIQQVNNSNNNNNNNHQQQQQQQLQQQLQQVQQLQQHQNNQQHQQMMS